MSTPLISVIMPMYNAAPFVGAAVRSILAQTVRDFELLIVDDASTDGSAEIVRAIPDERIRILHSETSLNAAGARNIALREARGEFIAFLDADDIAEPVRLTTQLRVLRDSCIGIVASRVALMDESGTPCGQNFAPRPGEEIPATLLFENCFALSSITARRASLQPFDPRFAPAEDYELWARIARATGFHICPEPLTRYRTHPGGISAKQPVQMCAAVQAIHAAQLARLEIENTPPIHAQIAAWPAKPSTAKLVSAENWLRILLKANDRLAIHPPPVFRRVIAARWFTLCMDSWSIGWPVWKIFTASVLASPTLTQRARLLHRLLPQLLRGK